MARGKSGRIVIEVDPILKKRLYLELEKKGLTLKDWFLGTAEDYIENVGQPSLFVAENNLKYEGSK